ncbi:MAG TPA: NAD(P)H-quinone oxidoreductase [Egibacteraceae bacterium]|nr:NAD(P)H-quinone oxidoreductase [Egibacteraceae bacterium]
MKAVVAPEPGGPEALHVLDAPEPRPGPEDLLVAVEATAVNRGDVMQRRGRYPPPRGATEILGLELAGEVVAVGDGVTRWAPGNRVCAVVSGGGYAEYAVVPAAVALPIPDGLTTEEAAALPEVFSTAHDNLFVRGRLTPGEAVLLHGGASGVGTAGIQLARRRGCRVLVTAGSADKIAACINLGADVGINYRTSDFAEVVDDDTDGRGVDVVLDIIGADYLERNLRCLATEGRLVVIGLMGGAKAEVDLSRLLARRLSVTASTLRARSVAEKAAVAERLRRDVWPGFADGSLRPVIDRVLPLEEAAEAHRVMEAGEHVGKIVLRVRSSQNPMTVAARPPHPAQR